MTETSKPPAAKATGQHKTVSIHSDGSKFHVQGDGSPSQEHADIDSALRHAKSIFGGHSGSDDVAEEAGGEGGM